MRAAVAVRAGGPDVIELIDIDTPRPGPGEILVRVAAAGINPVDVQTRDGVYHRLGAAGTFPVGLGWDFAGTVEQVGAEAGGPAVGSRVAGFAPGLDRPAGAYAEFVVVPADTVAEIPDALGFDAAATVPLNATTAQQALDLAGPARGRTLLVTGAAGGVGGYASAFGAERGFVVTGLARADDAAFVTATGGRLITDPPSAGSFDVVIDAAALGDSAVAAVMDGGTYVGVIPFALPTAQRGVAVSAVAAAPDAAVAADALVRTAEGRLPARIAALLPLEKATEAHRRWDLGGLRGRILLQP